MKQTDRKTRPVSRQEYDEARAVACKLQAALDGHRNATLRYYPGKSADIDGRAIGPLGNREVCIGSITARRPALVTIQQWNPIYVDVTQPARGSALALRRESYEGRLQKAG